MALLGWSSFQYDSLGWSLGPNVIRTAGTGQSGLASIEITGGSTQNASYSFSALTELITGFCHKFTILPGESRLVEFNSNLDLIVHVGADGSLIVKRNNGTAELGRTVSGIIAVNVECYIEIRARASTTVGQVEIRINGNPTPVLNLSGVNTGAASYDRLTFIGDGLNGTRDFSAWYFLDLTGPAPFADFLGHIRFAALQPSGNGNSSQLVGSDGNSTDNYLLVDDGFSHDSDTTYVQSPTVGEKDTYAMGNLPTAPSLIYAVCPLLIARKTDAGTRSIKSVIRRSGTDYDGATEHFLGTSYNTFKQAIEVDPSTSAAWTESGVNAMEVGPKVVS